MKADKFIIVYFTFDNDQTYSESVNDIDSVIRKIENDAEGRIKAIIPIYDC